MRRIILWVLFYSSIAGVVVFAVVLTNYYLNERTGDMKGQVNLSLPKLKYETGEEILFSVVNDSSNKIIIDNDCPEEPLMVYRWEDSRWLRIHKFISEDACPNQNRLITVEPHKSLTGSYGNWQTLFDKAGIYRIAVVVNGYSGLAYEDIEITDNTPAATPSTAQPVLEQKSIQIEGNNHREDEDRFEDYEERD
jgi:hypothetical protein